MNHIMSVKENYFNMLFFQIYKRQFTTKKWKGYVLKRVVMIHF